MKGNEQILRALNDLLSSELTAINQYMVHSEMCENWGYSKLHTFIESRARTEMKHAEKLIGRILFLEGIPIVNNYGKISIGNNVELQLKNDRLAEESAIREYNQAIIVATEVKDSGTKDFLQSILNEEEEHIDSIETQLELIQQMGIQWYLAENV